MFLRVPYYHLFSHTWHSVWTSVTNQTRIWAVHWSGETLFTTTTNAWLIDDNYIKLRLRSSSGDGSHLLPIRFAFTISCMRYVQHLTCKWKLPWGDLSISQDESRAPIPAGLCSVVLLSPCQRRKALRLKIFLCQNVQCVYTKRFHSKMEGWKK